MRLKDFQREMKNAVFTWPEARVVAFQTSPEVLRLQLYQWVKGGDLVRLKRGVYVLAETRPEMVAVAKALYGTCYISLEYALNHYGFLPDIPFAVTLVTPKATRKFTTPFGQYVYHTVKPGAFFGFDPVSLMAEPEKAIVDYLYLHRHQCRATPEFWREMRWQHLATAQFTKVIAYARRVGGRVLFALAESLRAYAKSPAAR